MADAKSFFTLQARAALLGAELRTARIDAERWAFVATARHVTHELPTIEDVERWLDAQFAAAEGTHA